MRKFLLATAMVLMVSGVSFAESVWTPTIRTVANGSSDVVTYIVGLHVDVESGGITSISDTNIIGNNSVCQVFPWDNGDWDWEQTPLEVRGRLIGNDFVYVDLLEDLGDNRVFDTHLLDLRHYSDTGNVIMVGDGWEESNDGSNPANISATDLDGALAGVGNMELIHCTTIAICNPLTDLSHIEFAQVVLPMGGTCTITGFCTNPFAASAAEAMIAYEIQVGEVTQVNASPRLRLAMAGVPVFDEVVSVVPEPSTVAMLILGGLCLVGARRRK